MQPNHIKIFEDPNFKTNFEIYPNSLFKKLEIVDATININNAKKIKFVYLYLKLNTIYK